MKMNGFEHRQYSVYTSKNSLTTYGIVDLMEKLSQKLPWLYLCINEIDVTDIGEQHSVKGILREFINQEEILIIKEEIPKEENEFGGKLCHTLLRTKGCEGSGPV